MIQANELRIGNWVKSIIPHDGKLVKFERFNEDFKVAFFNKEFIGAFIEHIQPIHLTPEILDKCGFEKQDNGWFKLNICKDYINLYFESLSKAELSISGLGMKMPHIKYLHQLQNLYFALTGEELNYTP